LADFSQAQSGAIAAVISCPPCRFLYANGNAAKNIRDMGLADSLGRSGCITEFPCSYACRRRRYSQRCRCLSARVTRSSR
jgi:hypothetical protein